jgi:tRNA isopentenyl-2-thiomethyl-A-37 hydroxylase MiaE
MPPPVPPQDVLDTLLERRELLHKLLESQVLEALVTSGILSVLLADSTRTQVFRQMVTGHALETLIDTNVLPALLGASSMEPMPVAVFTSD